MASKFLERLAAMLFFIPGAAVSGFILHLFLKVDWVTGLGVAVSMVPVLASYEFAYASRVRKPRA